MAKNMDRRVRKTRAQLRQGLAELLKEKSIKEITVKELVEKVDINRSTFYLHYADIYDMMEKIENELTREIEDLIHTHPVSPFNEDSFPFIEDIFSILAENRDICAALLGPRGDIGFLHHIEEMLSQYILTPLQRTQPDVAYRYTFCVAGGMGLIKDWLSRGCPESPQDMARRTDDLIAGVTHR